jgi:hypothetical protein
VNWSVASATWCLLRLVTGFCLAVLYIVIESWLDERASNENRGIILQLAR